MKKFLSIILALCILMSCAAITAFAEDTPSQKVYLAYPKENLSNDFPLVQKTKSGNYSLNAYCCPIYGNTSDFVTDDGGAFKPIVCKLEREDEDYLIFSADISQVGAIEPNADYILQFYSKAMTWNLTMTEACLGDTVIMTGESVTDNDMQTYYLVKWQNTTLCGMQAQLLSDNKLWCAEKGCTYLPVYGPKASLISDSLSRYLITSFKAKDTFKVNMNVFYADADLNRANCEKLGVNPIDVYAQYYEDNAQMLNEGEKQLLTLNGHETSVVFYEGKYYADLSCIANVLGLTASETEAFNAKEAAAAGDVNNDGIVNIEDATAVQKALAKLTVLNYRMMMRGDLSKNGTLDIEDATRIQKVTAKLITI